MSGRTLGMGERAFLKAMDFVSLLTQGYTAAFSEELLRQHGIRGFLKHAGTMTEGWKLLVEQFGARTAHLLAAFGSFWNGCGYCATGHVLGHNLLLYREKGELFPLDEHQLPELMRLPDREVLARLRQDLASRPELLALLERQHALKQGAQVVHAEDHALACANSLYDWVNECSIVVEGSGPPFDPVAKDKALCERYAQARAQARAASPAPAKASTVA